MRCKLTKIKTTRSESERQKLWRRQRIEYALGLMVLKPDICYTEFLNSV